MLNNMTCYNEIKSIVFERKFLIFNFYKIFTFIKIL